MRQAKDLNGVIRTQLFAVWFTLVHQTDRASVVVFVWCVKKVAKELMLPPILGLCR